MNGARPNIVTIDEAGLISDEALQRAARVIGEVRAGRGAQVIDLSELGRCGCGAYATVEGPDGEDWCETCAQRVATRILYGDGLSKPRHTTLKHKRTVKAKRKRERAARRRNRGQR